MLEKQFVSYMIALKLKELGFNEECFGYYDNWLNYGKEKTTFRLGLCKGDIKVVPTPLWQQAFDFLWDKTGKYIIPIPNDDKEWLCLGSKFKTYEEAKQACLEKLIEIYEQTRKNP